MLTQRKSHTSWRFLIDGNDSGRSTLLGSTKSESGTLLGPQKLDKKSSLRASMAAPPVKVGSYKGTIVSVKILIKKNLDINRSLKKQLYIRKEMTHDNINRFIGMSVESPHLYIVTQYCARGSLKVGFDKKFYISDISVIAGCRYICMCTKLVLNKGFRFYLSENDCMLYRQLTNEGQLSTRLFQIFKQTTVGELVN